MKNFEEYTFPEDLKEMTTEQLEELAHDIRQFLVRKVADTGGHLASNLGVVELTIALHKVFDSPKDKLLFDVGHQTYVHKILTGRSAGFDTLRQFEGMSGFPKQAESEHDVFDTGHASSSISLATGIAAARDLKGDDYEVVAVIGDGALTGGMAYEGLNNLGGMDSKVIVILNDNGMSIEKNTGGISLHLGKLRLSSNYKRTKQNVKSALNKVPVIGPSVAEGVSHMKNSLKYAMADDAAVFEAFGLTYMGPIDGHDIDQVIEALQVAKESNESVLIHCITKKGKGYEFAERMPDKFHGIGAFNPITGETGKSKDSYSSFFGRTLTQMALADENITAVCAAMISGTGLSIFADTFPERTFNVGIAEEHAVSFAAGLAKAGMKPFVCIYSTFLQRAYDQIIQDVCLQNLHVIFAIDRAGVVGSDGETHHGVFDISYLSSMPNMTVMCPKNYEELRLMMKFAAEYDGPVAIRYPRGSEESFPEEFSAAPVEYGKSQVLLTGNDVEVWAAGKTVRAAVDIFTILHDKGISCGVVDARFVSPIDRQALIASAAAGRLLVTLEDNVLAGGFGEKVCALISDEGLCTDVLRFGWPDKFIEHGKTEELGMEYELDAEHMAERIIERLERK